LLYDGPLLCGFNVAIKGLRQFAFVRTQHILILIFINSYLLVILRIGTLRRIVPTRNAPAIRLIGRHRACF